MDESTQMYYEQYWRGHNGGPYDVEDFAQYLESFGADVTVIEASNGAKSLQISYPPGSGFYE